MADGYRITDKQAPSPGDIRALGEGSVILLYPSARDRQDWPSILSALPNAIARGAEVLWED
jgi:hypothetical protein